MNLGNCGIALLLCISVYSHGQNSGKSFSELYITPHMGMSWQSTLFRPVLDFSYVSSDFALMDNPYDYIKNVQGFGLDAGFAITTNILSGLKMGIKTNGRFRYDYLYGDMDEWVPEGRYKEEYKGFLFDFSNALLLAYQTKRSPERELIGEIGFTINQMGKTAVFVPLNTTQYVRFNYQYISFNFGLGYDVIRLSEKFYVHTALFLNYIPYDFPGSRYPANSYMTLGIKALVRFKAGKIQLSHNTEGYKREPKLLRKKN